MRDRVHCTLRVETIHDYGDKVVIDWAVVDSSNSKFVDKYIDSCFLFDNRDLFYEQAQVKSSQYKTLKGQTFKGRIYQSRTGDWLVAPESLSTPANGPIAAPKPVFNPVLAASQVLVRPTPAAAPVPAPAPAPVITKAPPAPVAPVTQIYARNASDTKALNKTKDGIFLEFYDDGREERLARMKANKEDLAILKMMSDLVSAIEERNSKK